jgi:hypothetical protein
MELLELAQGVEQVPLVPDQGPVEQLRVRQHGSGPGRCAKDTGLRNLALASAVLLTVQPAAGERVPLVTVVGGIGLSFSVLLLLRVIVQILPERDLTSRAVTARKHQAGIMGWCRGGSGSSGF